jgi:hypothetical protein
MTVVSVKPQYREVYDGLQFAGAKKSSPRLHHGAWICEVYIPEDRLALSFRLGHLAELITDGIDELEGARKAGWNGEVYSDDKEVIVWTARERAWEMVHVAGQPDDELPGMERTHQPGQGEWKALENNLGRMPDSAERRLFETEFDRVLSDPSSTNEWPEA